MLILTRCVDDVILVGDNIEVKVMRIRGNKVRLGVTAPPDIAIDRSEIRALKNAAAAALNERQPRK